ncbi:WD40 repeat-like protein [Clavulina sp. PMI_390]|nr:WD40 repeat-like protein [Clavulina sp. PMI_390]
MRPKELRTNSNTVAWNCDGKKLLSCGLERGVRGWPLDNFDERSSFSLTAGLENPICSVSGHPTLPDALCGASDRDKKIVFWDFRARNATRSVKTDTAVRSVQYSADGQIVMLRENGDRESGNSGSDGPDTIALWDVRAGTQSAKVSMRDLGLGSRFNHNRQLIYVATSIGELAVVDYPSLKLLAQFNAHVDETTSLAVDVRGRYLATGGGDALVNLWDPLEWICERTLGAAESRIVGVASSHDGEWTAGACELGYIDIYETETGLHNARIPQKSNLRSLAWHPSQPILASSGGDRRNEAWISILQ